MYAKQMNRWFLFNNELGSFQATLAISYTFQREKVNMWKLHERFQDAGAHLIY